MRFRPAPRTRAAVARRTRRRRIVGAATSLAIVGGVAAAAVLSSVSVTGKVGVGQFSLQYASTGTPSGATVDATTLATVSGSPTFTPTVSADRRTLALPTTDSTGSTLVAYPGEALAVNVGVVLGNGAGKAGYISGVSVADASKVAGWNIRIHPNVCGAAVKTDGSTTAATLVITPKDGTAVSPLDLTAAGLSIVATGGTKPASLTCTEAGA